MTHDLRTFVPMAAADVAGSGPARARGLVPLELARARADSAALSHDIYAWLVKTR